MKIRANLGRQRDPLWPQKHQVDKVVELPHVLFASFMIQPLDRYDYIAQNRVEPHQGDGFTHCLLALSDECTDGVLVQCGGDGRAMYAAYVAGARDVVQAQLDRAVDFIVRQGTEHTVNGSWCIYFEELEEKFGLTIYEDSGLDAMLKETLERRPEVAAVEMICQHVDMTYHPEFCKSLNIRLDGGAPELVLEDVEAKELERFCDALEAHEQAEQAMGPTM